ncbi:MAG: GAF domain-containing SpoIIE family protein phosphatase [Bacteroidota bacterium]
MSEAADVKSERKRKTSEDRFDLAALFEFSGNINTTLELKFILNHFLLTVMGKIISPRGIILIEKTPNVFCVSTTKGLPASLAGNEIKIINHPNRIISLDHEDGRKYPWIKFFKSQGIHYLIPLIVREKALGFAGFSSVIPGKELSQKEQTYVKSLANITAAAIEKGLVVEEIRQVNRRLDRKVQELNTLFDLSKEFNIILDSDRLMKLLTFSLLGQVGTNKFFISLKHDGNMQIMQSRVGNDFNPDLPKYLATVRSPVIVQAIKSPKVKQIKSHLNDLGIRVLIPLQIHNETMGVIGVGDRMRKEPYSQTDIEFLSSLGNLAIISIENARLFRDAIEKQKMEDELLIAREIQKGLLPDKLPFIRGFEMDAINISSKQVGGDYYDIIPISPTKYVIAIGDVSGKGTPASLLMASLQATIRALVPLNLSLSELTKQVNDLICHNTGSDRFITFFWGIIDTENHTLNYVNAGHNPPYIFRSNGAIQRLDKGGIILGVMKTMVPYQEDRVAFFKNDVLLLFTDGVSESMDKNGQEYGEDRLEAIAKESLTLPPDAILSNIIASVKEHSKDTPQSDDITMIVVKSVL